MKKSSSTFVDKGITADQKEIAGLWVARNGKSVWILVSRTDGSCSHPQNTEQNPTQRRQTKASNSHHGPLASEKKLRRSKSYWACNIWEEKDLLAPTEGIINSRKQKRCICIPLVCFLQLFLFSSKHKHWNINK